MPTTDGKLILFASNFGGGDASFHTIGRIEALTKQPNTIDTTLFSSKSKYDYLYYGDADDEGDAHDIHEVDLEGEGRGEFMQSSQGGDPSPEPWLGDSKKIGPEMQEKALRFSLALG